MLRDSDSSWALFVVWHFSSVGEQRGLAGQGFALFGPASGTIGFGLVALAAEGVS